MARRAVRKRREFELVGGHAALDLVNTLDWRFRESGPEELLASYGDLVDFAEQARLLDGKQARRLRQQAGPERVLEQARDLREALANLMYAGLSGQDASSAAMRTLEKFLQAARAETRLVHAGRRLRWDWAGAETRAEFPLWVLARAAGGLLLSDDMERVRECGNPECRWLFLDTSKNQTRRWCDMKICGNRMKARRFKAAHRG